MRLDLNARMLDIARFHIGVLEDGTNRGRWIEEFQRAVNGRAEGEPWCMAFAWYCAKRVIDVHGGNPLLYPSESCLQVWERSPQGQRVPRARIAPGDWAIWQHGSTRAGHVGIVSELSLNHMSTVEGNTAEGSGVIREGDGVYLRARPLGDVGNMKLLGFLRMF